MNQRNRPLVLLPVLSCVLVAGLLALTPKAPTQPSVEHLVDRLAAPSSVPPEDKIEYWIYYMHPQVQEASDALVALGPAIVPQLREHLDDDRYSWTTCYAETVMHTVGDRVRRIIEDILHPEVQVAAYDPLEGKCRPVGFRVYLDLIGEENYYTWAMRSTPRQQELAYLRWYVGRLWRHERTLAGSCGSPPDGYIEAMEARITALEQAGVETDGLIRDEW